MAFKRKKLIFLLIVIVNDYHLYYCAGYLLFKQTAMKTTFYNFVLNIRLGGIA